MRGVIREVLGTFALALIIFALLQVTVETREVQLSSMEPSLFEGQYLMINKVVYRFKPPQRGDVIIFHYKNSPDLVYIKRVIGLPGEEIELKSGEVYLNGSELDEPYIPGVTPGKLKQTVPPDNYFVMGDNRISSSDSRHWGPILHDKIIGKAWFCYWPPTRWGPLPDYSFSPT
jgi:signal peptidase I